MEAGCASGGRWLCSGSRPGGSSHVSQESMDASASPLDADERANTLYWGSDLSVNQIAETLDLSKGALYEMIRPLPAEVACPRCRVEAVHPNRTALERGLVACLECGWDGGEGDA